VKRVLFDIICASIKIILFHPHSEDECPLLKYLIIFVAIFLERHSYIDSEGYDFKMCTKSYYHFVKNDTHFTVS